MPRTKSTPKRDVSNAEVDYTKSSGTDTKLSRASQNGAATANGSLNHSKNTSSATGILDLLICAGGIYASFLTWGYLQERITTTPYGPSSAPEIFNYPIVLNTIQSAFASITGYIYLQLSSRHLPRTPPIFPSTDIIAPLLLVSITSSLASPFGYASLKHVGYITFILAKSCKLLPVMALHISVFRRSYPFYKYAVVALVTAGVALFTLTHPSTGKKASKISEGAHMGWGIFLLSINLLFDGLTNSTQDWINTKFKGSGFGGASMMCAQNLMSTLLTVAYLFASPVLASTALGPMLGMAPPQPSTLLAHGEPAGELGQALGFIARNPSCLKDVLGFAACGAIGQVFIFYTLARFSSLLLVTITVTRKMLTMVLSVVAFGHRLSLGQWGGVALVFGGIGAEAWIGYQSKQKQALASKKGQ